MNAICLVTAFAGCLIAGTSAANCDCTAYDSTVSGSDGDCSKLKDYIACTFGKDTTEACDVPVDDRGEIDSKICTAGNELTGLCKCQLEYYKTDLSTAGEPCTALTAFGTCISKATAGACATERKAELTQFVIQRMTAESCACSEGDCNNGGSCPANGILPCTCVDNFTGPTCETAPECKDGDCKNGGKCATGGKLPCTCEEGYEGDKCESPGNFVVAAPGLVLILLLAAIFL